MVALGATVPAGALAAVGLALLAGPGRAQDPRVVDVRAPRVVALGAPVTLTGSVVPPARRVAVEQKRDGVWRRVGAGAATDASGRFRITVRPRLSRAMRLRVRAGETVSAAREVEGRPVTLAAVGDVNLGDRTAGLVAAEGPAAPWTSVGPTLRRADVAFANLECAISTRGAARVKEFTFRGTPAALAGARRSGGLDVISLANNHAGDFGPVALLDTVATARRLGLVAVGAGSTARRAAAPGVVEVLGLRIGFVGFSDVNPAGFLAGAGTPGTAPATEASIAGSVRSAARRADVVVAAFHWGEEKMTVPSARQEALAVAAVRAGARVVLGSHPHVLQPIRRSGRTVVAFSLGNFVFAAHSPGTTRTGILELDLSARGVERHRLRPARIRGVRPVLAG